MALIKLQNGAMLTVTDESIVAQYLKYGAVEVKPEEPEEVAEKPVKKRTGKSKLD